MLKESISKDRASQLTYKPVTALSGCLIFLKEIAIKGNRDKNKRILKQNDAFQIDEHDLQHWISLLSIPTEDIPHHLSTMHERWITQLQFNQHPAEKTQQWLSVILQRMLLDPTEGGTTRLTQSAVAMKSNSDQGDGKLTVFSVQPGTKIMEIAMCGMQTSGNTHLSNGPCHAICCLFKKLKLVSASF